ncbi:hypothetical protein V1478_001939 [Vespula squamosa]|uniref:Uncharacterized protein n=1 Tax=Vespula squamosa TaxID=30214 RepID=A0ABD2C060_VESSQ
MRRLCLANVSSTIRIKVGPGKRSSTAPAAFKFRNPRSLLQCEPLKEGENQYMELEFYVVKYGDHSTDRYVCVAHKYSTLCIPIDIGNIEAIERHLSDLGGLPFGA